MKGMKVFLVNWESAEYCKTLSNTVVIILRLEIRFARTFTHQVVFPVNRVVAKCPPHKKETEKKVEIN